MVELFIVFPPARHSLQPRALLCIHPLPHVDERFGAFRRSALGAVAWRSSRSNKEFLLLARRQRRCRLDDLSGSNLCDLIGLIAGKAPVVRCASAIAFLVPSTAGHGPPFISGGSDLVSSLPLPLTTTKRHPTIGMAATDTTWTPPAGRHPVNIGSSLTRALRTRKGIEPTKQSKNLPVSDFYLFRCPCRPLFALRFASG